MAFDEPGWQLLDDFFAHEAAGRTESTLRRYERVRDRLTGYLDVGDMAECLGTHPATVLDAERQFHEQGAFWLLFGPDELVCCLSPFLQEPWLPAGRSEARTQVSLVGRLLDHLRRKRLLDFSVVRCAYWDAEAAVEQARREIRERVPTVDPWATQIPGRLLGPSDPGW